MADSPISNDQREFRCMHCDGTIRIPRDLPPTTGPCPHCSGIITSPAQEISLPPTVTADPPPPTVVPSPIPETPPIQPPAPLQEPPPLPAPPPLPSPAPISSLAPPVLEIPAVPSGPPPLTSGRLSPPGPPVVSPLRNAEVEKPATPALAEKSEEKAPPSASTLRPAAKPQRSGVITFMLVLLALALILLGVAYMIIQQLDKNITPPVPEPASEETTSINEANYIRVGWQKDASRVLHQYMAGSTPQAKLPYVLNDEALAPKIEDFYGDSLINDSDTPADGFSVYELPEKDRQRGLFMMIYDLPPQFEIKEFFRPLVSLEVQHGLDQADLLLGSLARAANFIAEPVRVHAFFKRTPNGLKLDWETFAQTKYRTFLNFVELPEAGHSGVFRVIVMEDVPENGHAVPGTRTYRLVDPANISDSARVNVKIDSEVGRVLSEINWRDGSDSEPVTRTATVELVWDGESNALELSINRFICWEFLGLGGESAPATAAK